MGDLPFIDKGDSPANDKQNLPSPVGGQMIDKGDPPWNETLDLPRVAGGQLGVQLIKEELILAHMNKIDLIFSQYIKEMINSYKGFEW